VLTFFNELERELVVRIERTALRTDALTASRAGSLALFRELFPGESLSPGQLATVSTVTLLVAELDPFQADSLYQDLDDSRAFNIMQELFRLLGEAIGASGGAVVKTVGDGLLAAFPDPTSAVQLGLQIRENLSRSDLTRDLRLRVAIHHGIALAASINDHLDYFGTTARQVMKLTAHINAGELALSPAVASDPEVAALLAARGIEPEVVDAKESLLSYVIRIGRRKGTNLTT
jgi:class 3 adenylate cyclase